MEGQNQARLRMAVSMAAFGTLGPFVRHISLNSGEQALYRAVIAALFLCGYLLVTGQRPERAELKKVFLPLLISGFAMGFDWLMLFQAYRYTTVSLATLSYYFAPVIVIAASPILFHERMTSRQLVCFLMSTVGLVLLIGVQQLGGGGSDLKGILCGLGGAAFYAAVILLNKSIRTVSGVPRTVIQLFGAILVLVPYVALTGGFHLEELDGLGWGCLLTVGLVHTGVIYCVYFSAMKELRGQETAILSYIDPLVAVLVSVLILRERITLLQAAGGAMILGFTLWNEGGAQKSQST